MSPRRSLAAATVLLATLLAGPVPAAGEAAAPAPPLLLILDASGSMWGQIQGENKIVIARRVLKELIGEFYVTRHGEISPGQDPWYKLPVYSFHNGYFSGRGASGHAIKAQDMPGVPPMTETQLLAFKTFREMAKQFYFDMEFRPGDIQILHNHVTLHSRTAFEDWPEIERKRHLMRLWLTDWEGRPLKPGFRENIQGVNVAGTTPKAPVNVFEPA